PASRRSLRSCRAVYRLWMGQRRPVQVGPDGRIWAERSRCETGPRSLYSPTIYGSDTGPVSPPAHQAVGPHDREGVRDRAKKPGSLTAVRRFGMSTARVRPQVGLTRHGPARHIGGLT